MKKKVVLVVLAVAMALMAFAGCANNNAPAASDSATVTPADAAATDETPATDEPAATEDDGESADGSANGLRMGYLIQTQTTEFMLKVAAGIQDKCDELGIQLTINDADGDPATQVSQAESMIANGMDAIIVSAADADASAPVVEKCQDAGVPVIAVTNVFNDVVPDAFVGSDDTQSANLAVTALCDAIGGKGKIGMLRGFAGQSSEVIRSDATKKLLEEKYPEVELVVDDIGNWARDEAMSITENWIQKYGEELNGIFAQNDEMALGACNAIENQGLTGKILVTGIDLIPDSREYLEDGRLTANVFQNGYGQGQQAVEVAVAILQGQPYEKETWIPFELVTKENMDQYDFS